MEHVYQQTLKQMTLDLKQEFFEWCGSLSMDEIMANPQLITHVEKLERAIFSAIAMAEAPKKGK